MNHYMIMRGDSMKKMIATAVLLLLVLCGCTRTPTGNPAELRQYSWVGHTKGGGAVSLRFDGDKAALTLQNGGETAVITGACLTDDETLVIFDDASAQSYRFGYVPKGQTLLLRCGDSPDMELQAENGR